MHVSTVKTFKQFVSPKQAHWPHFKMVRNPSWNGLCWSRHN